MEVGIVTNAFAGHAAQEMFGQDERLEQSLVDSSLNFFQRPFRVVDEAFLLGKRFPCERSCFWFLVKGAVVLGGMAGQLSQLEARKSEQEFNIAERIQVKPLAGDASAYALTLVSVHRASQSVPNIRQGVRHPLHSCL
jgi:hypothetical protein